MGDEHGASEKQHDPVIIGEFDPDGKLVGRMYLHPEEHAELSPQLEQIAKARMDPAYQQRMAHFEVSLRRGEPRVAVADVQLARGAAAIVVRDPSEPPQRIVIVGSDEPSETAIALGLATLRQSEIALLDAPSRMMVVRWLDGRFEIFLGGLLVTAGSASWRRVNSDLSRFTALRNEALQGRRDVIPEVGLVWITS